MKELETGKDKIRKICDVLKKETLDPAKEQATKIIEQAEEQAKILIKKAEAEAKAFTLQSQTTLAKEKALFEKQVREALQQAKEILRQEIETKLFNVGLQSWLEKEGSDPTLAAKIITALIEAVEKEGLHADFSAKIGKTTSVEKVNANLLAHTLQKLQEKSVIVGNFSAGAQLQLRDRKLTLDMSDLALKELLGSLVRKEFRDLLFKES